MTRNRAVAIIVHNDKLLVMYREEDGKKYYTFPGGGVESGETAEQAVIREIDEEASIKISVDGLLYDGKYENGDTHYFFNCKYISGTPELRADAIERVQDKLHNCVHKPEWLALSEIAQAILYPIPIRDRFIQDMKSPKNGKLAKVQLSMTGNNSSWSC